MKRPPGVSSITQQFDIKVFAEGVEPIDRKTFHVCNLSRTNNH